MNQRIDLADLDTVAACDQGAEIELRHPTTGAGLKVFIEIVGKDSTIFRNASRKITNLRIQRSDQAARRGKDPDSRTVEQVEQENIDILVACTKSWRTVDEKGVSTPVLLLKGEQVAFSAARARELYSAYPWIYDQVNEGIGSLENFI